MDPSGNPVSTVSSISPADPTSVPSERPPQALAEDHPAPPPGHEENRADLVLFLGIISLLMCGPLGVVPWIMANADLKRYREGKLSHRRLKALKVGKALGIGGILVFLVSVAVGAVAWHRGFDPMSGQIDWTGLLRGPTPLPADRIVFAGEWRGHRGTFIRINPDGTGDYRSRDSMLEGGRVTIDEHSISIGNPTVSRNWRIERIPTLKHGTWTMKLNGEVFRKRTRGFTVNARIDLFAESA